MDFEGDYRLPVPRQAVWPALNDPETLRACIPGCESLEWIDENRLSAVLVVKIGPLKARFTGEVRLEDVVPFQSYTLAGEGKGGLAGFASGSANVRLREEGAETVLAYTAQAQIGGRIAQLGGRFVDASARKLADRFFARFAARISGDAAPPADVA